MLSFLRFSPEERGGAPPPEQEEAVPGQEQEQPGEEGVSGAPEKPEDEARPSADPKEAFLEQLQETAKDDPELAKAIQDRFGKPAEEVSEEEWQKEVQARNAERLAQAGSAAAEANRYGPQAIDRATADWLDGLGKQAQDAFEKAAADPSGQTRFALDLSAHKQALGTYVRTARQAAVNAVSVYYETAIINTLEASPITRELSDEDYAAIQEAAQAADMPSRIGGLLAVYFQAASRTKDAAKMEQQIRTKLEQELGQVERFQKLLDALPTKNGQRQAAGARAERRTDDEILADPKTPVPKLQEILARRQAGR